MQSNVECKIDIAIIMDGNGRWATKRGLPRSAGHQAGVSALRTTVAAAARLGVKSLTVYAFSAENWQRPEPEVSALMSLVRRFMSQELANLYAQNIRLTFIGRRDRIDPDIAAHMMHAEAITCDRTALHLRIALDYSARDAILRVADRFARVGASRDAFGRALADDGGPETLDLLIRTGGEKRLSDFLLWEAAYAELWFTETLWPDFDAATLAAAIEDFQQRDRRFGGLPRSENGLGSGAVQ